MSRLNTYRESVLNTGYDFVKSRVLQTAFELDLFERVGRESASVATLAKDIKADEKALELFMNSLVSLGFLDSIGRGYQNTKYGREIFLKGRPYYIGDMVRLMTKSNADWMKLKDAVVSGKPIEQPDFFKTNDDEATAGFARAMQNTALGHAEYLAKKFLLPGAMKMLDMGGGPGTFTIEFLKVNRVLRAVIFDLPTTLKTTRQLVEAAGVANRVAYQEGDFNETDIEGSFDACFLSHIIHGQTTEKNKLLFRKISDHLNPGGEFIVQDFFLNPDKQSPQFSALFALNMLVHTDGGRTYTFDETESWMKEVGITPQRRPQLHLPRGIALVVGEKK